MKEITKAAKVDGLFTKNEVKIDDATLKYINELDNLKIKKEIKEEIDKDLS